MFSLFCVCCLFVCLFVCLFQIEKMKTAGNVPFLLPKSYAKLKNEAPSGLKSSVTDCQVQLANVFLDLLNLLLT